jgi:gliding motility-associated-like protein
MKRLFIIIFAFLLTIPSHATHYMGGEITWECLPNGNYRFTMKIYRECYTTNGNNAANFGNTELLRTTVPGLTQITMTRISLLDMSPQCNTNPLFTPKIFCPGMAGGAANMGALQENIYTSDASYPNGVTLNGVPPAQGWMFWHQGCCRNPCTNIINASGITWRLRAIMYSYNGQNANPCFDNSPVFAERPSTVICTGYPFTYNHNAFDPDLDSLVYEWATSLDQSGNVITQYAAGYSFTNPLPGTMHNPQNVPATVDPNTGEISFTSYTQGAFVTVVKVSTYRCGILIAEIFREIQVVLLSCGANNPPDVQPPFQDPNTGLYTLYVDTVFAGDLVTFSVTGTDFDLMPNGTTPQTMTIEASGGQFGAGFTNQAAGCLYPPCAVLNPPPPVIGQFGVITNFSWQTSCAHIATDAGCGTLTNSYNFLIKVSDDFCPAPAINFNTVSIVVISPLIDPPDLRCVQTLQNGDVQLTWISPSDPYNTFDSYHIFYSTDIAGPYNVIDSVFNINQTTWTHAGANGNNLQGYYYIKTRGGCSGMDFKPITTDTISNILLQVGNPGTGVAQLTWNHIKQPPMPSTSPMYLIYRDNGTGTPTLIDSTTTTSYNDTVIFCNADLTYQIHQYDSSGCFNISNIDGDNFSDVTPPDTPFLEFVTVELPDQKPLLQWQASNAPDVVGYIVYRFTGGVWVPIDTVPDLFYKDLAVNPDINSEAYRVAAIDSCDNTSPMSLEHRTIYLTSTKDICDDQITINWTEYINLGASLSAYEIHFSTNGGPYQFLTSVAPTTTNFVHNGLTDSTHYCYIVMAINDDGSRMPQSNFSCQTASLPFQPQFAYIRYVTVVDNSYIEIAMFTDTTAKVAGYRLEKSTNDGVSFVQMANLPPSIDPFIYYNDNQVEVGQNVYTYRFVVRDSCGVDAITSNIASSILLQGEQGDDMFTNLLQWTDYEGWPTGVMAYDVYRGTTDVLSPEYIAQVPTGTGLYLDAFPDDVIMSEGKMSYFVEGIEAAGNPLGFNEVSKSNYVFIPQPPRIYVPNAFTPGGRNPIFRPLTIFIDHNEYFFAVYDRWGKEIFQTTDIEQGWDGTYNSWYVQEGTYVYVLKAKFATGIKFEKRGIVTVIR